MFVAKAYSIEYLAFQDAPDGQFSDEIINPKPPRGQQIHTLCNRIYRIDIIIVKKTETFRLVYSR